MLQGQALGVVEDKLKTFEGGGVVQDLIEV
jgi:hypothetical protein